MTRFVLTLGITVISANGVFAVISAPVPRLTEWKIPGVDRSEPMPDEPQDPAKILERVTKNARSAGDRLKELDAGEQTRKTQDQVLQDIDRLLKQNENSPPPPSGGGGMSEMPPADGGVMKPPPSGGSGMNPMPMGNSGSGRQRPPRGSGMPDSQPMNPGGMKEPIMQPAGGTGTKDPMMQPGSPMNSLNQSGTPMGPGSKAPPLPNEDPFTKQVWGHLPEKLRQQASQYYREQYMPKYQEMLKRYYSDLAEREKPANKK